jgi:hypothetical protein
VHIPPPVMSMMGVYIHAYLFEEVPVGFLYHTQLLLACWLPQNALGPLWLWRLLFADLWSMFEE